MPIYHTRSAEEMIVDALRRLQKTTPVTSIGAGSVARAITEVIVNEVDRFNGVLDFAMANTLISTATGRSLDQLGVLYGIERKKLGQIATDNQQLGTFYFYLDQAHNEDIFIPAGTRISTDSTNRAGRNATYVTTTNVTIPSGRTRIYTHIRPLDNQSIYTAAPHTLTVNGFEHPEVDVKSTNPKEIVPTIGYEGDRAYRSRIIKAVRTTAGGTAEALRFKALGVEGVRDILVRDAPYGLGTAEVIVVPEEYPNRLEVQVRVSDEVEKSRPTGVRVIYRLPDYISVGATMDVIVKPEFANVPIDGAARRAEIAIIRYINTLLPGDKLVYARLLDAVLDSSDIIEDVVFRNLNVRGEEVLRQTQETQDYEQFVPGNITATAILG